MLAHRLTLIDLTIPQSWQEITKKIKRKHIKFKAWFNLKLLLQLKMSDLKLISIHIKLYKRETTDSNRFATQMSIDEAIFSLTPINFPAPFHHV